MSYSCNGILKRSSENKWAIATYWVKKVQMNVYYLIYLHKVYQFKKYKTIYDLKAIMK